MRQNVEKNKHLFITQDYLVVLSRILLFKNPEIFWIPACADTVTALHFKSRRCMRLQKCVILKG